MRCATLLLTIAILACPQAGSATLTGRITDPAAAVTAIHEESGATQTTLINDMSSPPSPPPPR